MVPWDGEDRWFLEETLLSWVGSEGVTPFLGFHPPYPGTSSWKPPQTTCGSSFPQMPKLQLLQPVLQPPSHHTNLTPYPWLILNPVSAMLSQQHAISLSLLQVWFHTAPHPQQGPPPVADPPVLPLPTAQPAWSSLAWDPFLLSPNASVSGTGSLRHPRAQQWHCG